MGGGQANSRQASTAANQQTAASNQDMALSSQNQQRQQQLMNTLFGNGSPGSSGTLTGMLDPKSLNTGSPTGAYQTAWNNAQNNIAQNYAQQKGSLAQDWANRGMSSNNTPSGFMADQQRKLGSSEADTRGSTYTGIVGQQHQDALNNFWNANNIASGQAANAGSNALQGSGQSGTSSAQIYGTAGQYHAPAAASIAGSALQAGGQVGGAAMCPAEGSMIRMSDGSRKLVQELTKGEKLLGIDGKPDELLDDPQPSVQEVCEVYTTEAKTRVSLTHAFARTAGGYAIAARGVGETIDTDHGPRGVVEVRVTGERLVCFHLFLKRSHGYNADGMWSLE